MEITTTKTVMLNGTSLTITVTKEVREMGLDRGDEVDVILIPHVSD